MIEVAVGESEASKQKVEKVWGQDVGEHAWRVSYLSPILASATVDEFLRHKIQLIFFDLSPGSLPYTSP